MQQVYKNKIANKLKMGKDYEQAICGGKNDKKCLVTNVTSNEANSN